MQIIVDMAYRTGRSQSYLQRSFTSYEIKQIIALKELQYESISKEDRRTQYLGYWNALSHTDKPAEVDVKFFELDWTKTEEVKVDYGDVERVMEALAARLNGTVTRK